MNGSDDDLSPPYITSYDDAPYSSSLASSASSSSSASVWSDAASQSSDDSSVHSGASDSEISDSYCYATQQSAYQTETCDVITPTTCWPKSILASIVPEQRPHPRRTSGAASRTGGPPSLIRQCDRKVSFVDSLVGKIIDLLEKVNMLNKYPRFLCANRGSDMAPFVRRLPKRPTPENIYSGDSAPVTDKLLDSASCTVLLDPD